jgi:hypothetical protein
MTEVKKKRGNGALGVKDRRGYTDAANPLIADVFLLARE